VAFRFKVKIGRRRWLVELEDSTPGVRAVWIVQRRLAALGLLDPLAASGRVLPETRAALRRFERLAGLPITGDPHAPATRITLREQVRAAQAAGRLAPDVP
jgi:hypothetical protein